MRNKYLVTIFLSGLLCSCGKNNAGDPPEPPKPKTTFTNPLLGAGADPWVIQKDTNYYYTHTTGNNIVLYKTNKMSTLSSAVSAIAWTPPATGAYSRNIWAPELHYLQNKWYLYFAADNGDNANHRMYALENASPDPQKGEWIFKGKIADMTNDRWAIDGSVFEYNSKLYFIWSGWQGTTNVQQDIFIAQMSNPYTLSSNRVLISSPQYDWEKVGSPTVNEGPQALINPQGKLFLTYSASGCWTDSYALGLLTLKTGGDPLVAADWIKSPAPIFTTNATANAYGPGHNSFFVSRDGTQNWVLYHANAQASQGCGAARTPRMQQFSWNTDGSPNFGTPAKINTPIQKPSGE